MATFLFWNLNKRPLLNQVATLCHEHKVDVLVLAESSFRRLKGAELLPAVYAGAQYVDGLRQSTRTQQRMAA
jgi:hypothetical protein